MNLVDHLGIAKIDIVAHSLGGMLGVRIARAYPDRINHLMLAAPIGLEDYRMYVPPTATEKIIENEDKLTAEEAYRRRISKAAREQLFAENPARADHALHRCALQYQGRLRLSALAARVRQFRANDLPRTGGVRNSASFGTDAVHHGRG
jgi:pimeloyl-ACP methyl ester carboxylesterase